MQRNVVFIGITGLAGSGKDQVATLLEKVAGEYDFRVRRFKLSDVIREELNRQGEVENEVSRLTLIRAGNELREKHGHGILAHRTVEKYKETESKGNWVNIVIITGIRTLGEIEILRSNWNERFILLGVLAKHQLRKKRMKSREQYQEDAIYSNEVDQADQDIGIRACLEVVNHKLSNDGSLEQLSLQVDTFFEQFVRSRLKQNTNNNQG